MQRKYSYFQVSLNRTVTKKQFLDFDFHNTFEFIVDKGVYKG